MKNNTNVNNNNNNNKLNWNKHSSNIDYNEKDSKDMLDDCQEKEKENGNDEKGVQIEMGANRFINDSYQNRFSTITLNATTTDHSVTSYNLQIG